MHPGLGHDAQEGRTGLPSNTHPQGLWPPVGSLRHIIHWLYPARLLCGWHSLRKAGRRELMKCNSHDPTVPRGSLSPRNIHRALQSMVLFHPSFQNRPPCSRVDSRLKHDWNSFANDRGFLRLSLYQKQCLISRKRGKHFHTSAWRSGRWLKWWHPSLACVRCWLNPCYHMIPQYYWG